MLPLHQRGGHIFHHGEKRLREYGECCQCSQKNQGQEHPGIGFLFHEGGVVIVLTREKTSDCDREQIGGRQQSGNQQNDRSQPADDGDAA